MRDSRVVRCVYRIEAAGDPRRAAEILAGEQSSGTFVPVPGETDRVRRRHGAQVTRVDERGVGAPSLPSRIPADRVRIADVVVEFPMENVSTDITTLMTTVAGNLFELAPLYACRLMSVELPDAFVAAHPGPRHGVPGTRRSVGRPAGALVGTIVKPNVGLDRDEYRATVRALAATGLDLIKDDELMTDPDYLPLAERVRIVGEETDRAAQLSGHRPVYAFNVSGDLAGLERRYDRVVSGGGTCVMVNIPVMGLAALEWLRSFGDLLIHGHRAGLAASTRSPALGVDYTAWQQLARLAGADHLHVSGLGGKFYETDDQVVANVAALRTPLGTTLLPVPALSSGQSVRTPDPTYRAIGTDDVLMLAGGGVAAHPGGPAAGVRSLRQAWDAALAGEDVAVAATRLEAAGDTALTEALKHFPEVG